ncbi:hypothetical protein [Pengzhenrongella sicca]|uniref:Uncharacterized protein n=1 Tax=Pengzhenrongella sicca TaxID=2819238 RepID=A0A8A4ZID0_9MICO|nr:hypothetical protein [Pengzhenrongella sicca]QTE29368.1 hypothetical protein J4E96_19205 [Pengzhenrongella sicca]
MSEALEWFAPYVDLSYVDEKALVGYADYELAPRPHLFWVDAGQWIVEDLNPNNHWG